jgi:hypothetical protein
VKIVLIIDNATWHNQLTEDTIPPKRAWRKDLVMQWLVNHNIRVPFKATKAELIVLALDNLPPKHYVIDEAAKKYNVDVLRLVEFLQNYLYYNVEWLSVCYRVKVQRLKVNFS